jgi:hypothetical protein
MDLLPNAISASEARFVYLILGDEVTDNLSAIRLTVLGREPERAQDSSARGEEFVTSTNCVGLLTSVSFPRLSCNLNSAIPSTDPAWWRVPV